MKILIIIVYLSLNIYGNSHNNQKATVLCFAFGKDEAKSICQYKESKVILFSPKITLNDTIRVIQKQVRFETSKNQKVILMAKGFTGTLLSIAQTNLLPYYRKNIKGLILEESPPNLFDICMIEKSRENAEICKKVNTFKEELNGLASRMETFISLSPVLQMDSYWSKTLVLGNKYKEEWIKAFEENSVDYLTKSKLYKEDVLRYFPFITSQKVQPKSKKIKPDYYGPLLRFHLNKILYSAKNDIFLESNVTYGTHKLQSYDVYFKKKSKDNPIAIFVHGGGWKEGDKKNYENFSKQYADKGFTSVSINYRLMGSSEVGMEEMLQDVKKAIEHIMDNSSKYGGDRDKVVLISESAGAQLTYLAVSRLKKIYRIRASFFNSMPTDLRLLSEEKQANLSNIKVKEKRLKWLNDYSPINNLDKYSIPTFITHSFNDNIVAPKHLDFLSILSVLHADNIFSYWINYGVHPILPKHKALEPSYLDVEFDSMNFINNKMVKKY